MKHPQPPESKYFELRTLEYIAKKKWCFIVYYDSYGSYNIVPIDSIEDDNPLCFIVAAVAIAEINRGQQTGDNLLLTRDWQKWEKGEYK